MWIRKFERDRKKGIDSAVPTQLVSNVLWWGSPQWCIDAFKRFQISDEMCEKFGYQKLTKEDKARIFGLNAAKLYGIDVKAQRKALPADTLTRLKGTVCREWRYARQCRARVGAG